MKDFDYLEKKIKELKKKIYKNKDFDNLSSLSSDSFDLNNNINESNLKKISKYLNFTQKNTKSYKYKIILVLILLFILHKNKNMLPFVSNIFNNFLSSNDINQSEESNDKSENSDSLNDSNNFLSYFNNFLKNNNYSDKEYKNNNNLNNNNINKNNKISSNLQNIFENNQRITMNHINTLNSKIQEHDDDFEDINKKIELIQKNIINIDDDMKNLQTNIYSNHFKHNILSKKNYFFNKPSLFLSPEEFNNKYIEYQIQNNFLDKNKNLIPNQQNIYNNFYQNNKNNFNNNLISEDSSLKYSDISLSDISHEDNNHHNHNNNNLNNNQNHQNNNKNCDIKEYVPQSIFLKNYENLEVSNINNKLTFNFKIRNSYYNHFKLYSILNQEFFGLIKIKFYLVHHPNYYFIYTYNQNNSIYSSLHQYGFIIENNYLNLPNKTPLDCDFNKENYINNNPILNLNQYENNNDKDNIHFYHDVCCEIDFIPNPNKNIDTNQTDKLDSQLILNQEGITEDYFKTFNFNILKFKFEVIQTKKPEMQSLKPLNIEISHDSNKSPLIVKNQIKSIFSIGEYDDKEYWSKLIEKNNQINRSIQFVENVTSGNQTLHFK